MTWRCRLLGLVALAAGAVGCWIREPCTSGECCDSYGRLADSSRICLDRTEVSCGAACDPHVYRRTVRGYCSGVSTQCNGRVETSEWHVSITCAAPTTCNADDLSYRPCGCEDACVSLPYLCWDRRAWCAYEGCSGTCCDAAQGCAGDRCTSVTRVDEAFSVAGAEHWRAPLLAWVDGGVVLASRDAVTSAWQIERRYATGATMWSQRLTASVELAVAADSSGHFVGAATLEPACAVVSSLGATGAPAWTRRLCASSPVFTPVLAVGTDGSLWLAVSGRDTWTAERTDGTYEALGPALAALVRWDATGTLQMATPIAVPGTVPAWSDGSRPGALLPWNDGVVLVGRYGGSQVLVDTGSGAFELDRRGIFISRYAGDGTFVAPPATLQTTSPVAIEPELLSAAVSADGGVVLAVSLRDSGSLSRTGAGSVAVREGAGFVAVDAANGPAWANNWTRQGGVVVEVSLVAAGSSIVVAFEGSDYDGFASQSGTYLGVLGSGGLLDRYELIADWRDKVTLAAHENSIVVGCAGPPSRLPKGEPASAVTLMDTQPAVLMVDLER